MFFSSVFCMQSSHFLLNQRSFTNTFPLYPLAPGNADINNVCKLKPTAFNCISTFSYRYVGTTSSMSLGVKLANVHHIIQFAIHVY